MNTAIYNAMRNAATIGAKKNIYTVPEKRTVKKRKWNFLRLIK
ncbi:MAG: hypothetical protein ABI091_26860 [Ferruginibacter sp.]